MIIDPKDTKKPPVIQVNNPAAGKALGSLLAGIETEENL